MKYLNYLIVLIMMSGCTNNKQKMSSGSEDIASTIIALEKQALELWNNGNPDGFLELSSEQVVYMDPFFEQKLEGKKALEEYYNTVRGQIKVDRYEMVKPVVQPAAECAVLTYNYVAQAQGQTHRWNCTEVFRLDPDGKWKIIHTHWSPIKPME